LPVEPVEEVPIAILQMIDQLADAISQGRPVPLTSLRLVNAGELLQLLERMRISVPGSIMESERTLAERDRILAEASAEAERLIQQTRQRAVEILSDNALVITARQEAERVAEEGRQMALRRAEEADRYAMQVLEELEGKLQGMAKQVENGIKLLKTNSLNTQQANSTHATSGLP
jgi:hypothetical protein